MQRLPPTVLHALLYRGQISVPWYRPVLYLRTVRVLDAVSDAHDWPQLTFGMSNVSFCTRSVCVRGTLHMEQPVIGELFDLRRRFPDPQNFPGFRFKSLTAALLPL